MITTNLDLSGVNERDAPVATQLAELLINFLEAEGFTGSVNGRTDGPLLIRIERDGCEGTLSVMRDRIAEIEVAPAFYRHERVAEEYKALCSMIQRSWPSAS